MLEKKAITQAPIHDLIARRWSGRAYDPERTVEGETLLSLLEAARWAPSCYGNQPWRFLIWNRHRDGEDWRRAFECLSEGNRSWAGNAALLMLAAADGVFTHNGRPNRWGQYDTGAASENLCLQAAALGLMAHQMGGFDADGLRSAFAIPERVTPMAMIALGYALPEDRIPESLREREYAPRARRPLEELCFSRRWGAALER